MKVPFTVQVVPLCFENEDRLRRRYNTLHTAATLFAATDTLLARMPNYEAAWCYRVAQKKKIRIIIELHGDWETSIRAEDNQSVLRRTSRTLRSRCARKIVEEMSANAICAVGIGPELIKKYVPHSVPSLTLTNNLLSEKEYHERKVFSLRDPPKILFVGDMQRRKGLHYLFTALSKLKACGKSFDMLMVGSGPMIPKLQAYSWEHGFANNVKWAGYISHADNLFACFREADVFVLPSIASEGVPRVTHEAMALGCPVIATDIGSVSWQLSDGAGIVISSCDAEEITAAILKIFESDALRKSIPERGYKRSLEFTLERQQKLLKDFILRYSEMEN